MCSCNHSKENVGVSIFLGYLASTCDVCFLLYLHISSFVLFDCVVWYAFRAIFSI